MAWTFYNSDGQRLVKQSAGGVSLTGSTDNTITTVTGACAIQGEDKLTYDGTDFVVQQCGGSATGSSIISRNYNDGGNPARVRMQTSRNDSASHTAVTNGTPLGFVQFEGSDGSAFQRGAYIEATAGATWSGSNRQTYLNWYVTPSGCSTSNTLTMRLTSDGQLRLKDGSASAPSFSFNCDTDLGFYRHGTNAISFTGGAQQGLTFSDPGVIYARDTANGNMSIGLTLNQQATDNDIFSLKSTDVAHGATNVSETDTYMAMGKAEGTAGGLDMRVFSDAQGNSDSRSFMLRTMVTGGSTTKTTSARAPFWVYAAGISGTCDADLGSDENLMVISNRGTTRFIFDVEGTAHADVGTATFDDYCDVELLRGLLGQTVDGYKENYRNRFGKDLMYNLPFYEENKLIGKDSIHWEQRDCGKWEQRAMINTTGLTMLHHSTIIQLADRVDARLTALENQIALQGGK